MELRTRLARFKISFTIRQNQYLKLFEYPPLFLLQFRHKKTLKWNLSSTTIYKMDHWFLKKHAKTKNLT